MKTIQTNAIITSVRSRVDNSLGLSIETPEYTPEESIEILRLKGNNVRLTIMPLEASDGEIVIDRQAGDKSPSERLRGVIYRIWEGKKDKWSDFEMYYRHAMEQIIEQMKEKIM